MSFKDIVQHIAIGWKDSQADIIIAKAATVAIHSVSLSMAHPVHQ